MSDAPRPDELAQLLAMRESGQGAPIGETLGFRLVEIEMYRFPESDKNEIHGGTRSADDGYGCEPGARPPFPPLADDTGFLVSFL